MGTCLNIFLFYWERLLIVLTALFVNLTQVCFLGLCYEEVMSEPSSFASHVFVLAFALIFSDYNWVPRKINNTSRTAAFIIKMGATVLATDLVMKLVWDPFSLAIHKVLKVLAEYIMYINDELNFESNSVFACMAETLEEEFIHSLLLSVIAFVCLYWVLDGLGCVTLAISKIRCVTSGRQECTPCSSTQQDIMPKRQKRLNR